MNLLIIILVLVLIVWAFEYFYLRGGHRVFPKRIVDPDIYRVIDSGPDTSPPQQAVRDTVRVLAGRIKAALDEHQLSTARAVFDSISDNREYASEFRPVDAGGVDAEWVLAPNADPAQRMLYIHGGGFIMGCPKSHRTITSRLSEVCGCAVLSIDYRLMPKHQHTACVEDCRTAYHWILENGPAGPDRASQVFFGGDSAGGNLALSLAAWVRDKGLRAPDAIVALSPLTDVTFSGASLRDNWPTDVMLRRVMGTLNKLPPFIRSWWVVKTYRVRPANPLVSPLLGDLSDLPPTLIQASEAEMLLDDARRYVFKAHAAGSPIKLQTWTSMVHIWQIFYPDLPQAGEAFDEIGKFIQQQTGGVFDNDLSEMVRGSASPVGDRQYPG